MAIPKNKQTEFWKKEIPLSVTAFENCRSAIRQPVYPITGSNSQFTPITGAIVLVIASGWKDIQRTKGKNVKESIQ